MAFFDIDTTAVIRNFELSNHSIRVSQLDNYLNGLPLTDIKSMLILNLFYFVMLFVLRKYMDSREAFNPRKFMIFYNFTCMCLATYCFGGMVWFYYLKGNAFTCQNVDFDTEDAKWIAHVREDDFCYLVCVYLLRAEILGVY